MTISNTTVEPVGSKVPMRSGTVSSIRYQLKHTLPVERRASSVVGSIASHVESSKSAAPALGV